jgi:hypothetical protein
VALAGGEAAPAVSRCVPESAALRGGTSELRRVSSPASAGGGVRVPVATGFAGAVRPHDGQLLPETAELPQ